MKTYSNNESNLNKNKKYTGGHFSAVVTNDFPQSGKGKNIKQKNFISKTIKNCGVIILAFGTISSFIIASNRDYGSSFSFIGFLVTELISIFISFVLIGLSEIIQLLDDIKKQKVKGD